MMFARGFKPAEEEDKKDIFAPVADLMVGVVFIFIILMIALVLNLQKEDTVPKSEYDQMVARVESLTAENRALNASLVQERAANARLTDFVRFVRDSNVMRIMSELASADQTRSHLLEEIRKRLTDFWDRRYGELGSWNSYASCTSPV